MGPDPLLIRPGPEVARVTKFIKRTVLDADAKGAVLGVSGGVDSAVVGELCVRALGKEKVVTMLLPSRHTPRKDVDDAEALASRWGTRTYRVSIDPLVEKALAITGMDGDRMASANLQARVRMTLLYLAANREGLLVAGTGDRSEEEVGFFTKFGDGGADFLPIAHLYKTQVRVLASHLGLPREVVEKPASPQLWPGHTAAQELPADYDKLDLVLHYLYDLRLTPAKAATRSGVAKEVAERVLAMHERTKHKRSLPPSLVPARL